LWYIANIKAQYLGKTMDTATTEEVITDVHDRLKEAIALIESNLDKECEQLPDPCVLEAYRSLILTALNSSSYQVLQSNWVGCIFPISSPCTTASVELYFDRGVMLYIVHKGHVVTIIPYASIKLDADFKWGQMVELVQPRIKGTSLRCTSRPENRRCGGNVFRHEHGTKVYQCNACGALYDGE
jgi:hypothetical protein